MKYLTWFLVGFSALPLMAGAVNVLLALAVVAAVWVRP